MTIIETTVILSVLFILAGVMSPIVSESVNTARAVKAKNDAGMIAMGLINFQKDVGADSLAVGGAAAAIQSIVEWPEVLATAGAPPTTEDDRETSSASLELFKAPGSANDADRNRDRRDSTPGQRRRWFDARTGALDDLLVTNRRGYRMRRPGEYGGWNGPYVSTEVKGDAWGNQFLINSVFLDGGSSVADRSGNPRRAVFVISAGVNGVIETPFEQSIIDARAYGDDIVVRIQ